MLGGIRKRGEGYTGFWTTNDPLGNGVIGRVSDLARMARTGFVDEVILAAPHDRSLTVQVVREASACGWMWRLFQNCSAASRRKQSSSEWEICR